MSNIVLQPNASGTGSITITTPNTNTDRTLNIPDVAGNLVTTGDTGTVTGTMIGSLPVGSIIQVKSTTVSGNLGTGTQDLVSVSITPTDNNNKILVIGSGLAYVPQGVGTAVDIYRDSTFIFRTAGGVGWGDVNGNNNESFTPTLLDDPQTTSAITYKMQGLQTSGSGATWGYYDSNNTGSTSITVMEVVV
jgi:hypothetical protein